MASEFPSRAAGLPEGEAIERILAYHERSKHHLEQYGRGPGFLDWATQPNPFRTYAGAPRVELALEADHLETTFGGLHFPGAVAARPLTRKTVGILLELALGLSAWKQIQGSRWALHCNPSSGNLHPTEGYVLLPGCPGLKQGLYHYVSRDHVLERRCLLGETGQSYLGRWLAPGSLLIGLASIHWREAWKYGERAFRYCQHDAGHALATIRLAAAALGWSAILLDDWSDPARATCMGIDRAEDFAGLDPADREHPDGMVLVGPAAEGIQEEPMLNLEEVFQGGTWAGQANSLSPAHVDWGLVEEAARATWKPTTRVRGQAPLPSVPGLDDSRPVAAATLIRQRRSCLALDGQTSIEAQTFFAMLDQLLPRPGIPPWDVLPWQPNLHLALLVHRVRGLPAGLYLLERSAAVHERLRAALRVDFSWSRPAGCPEHLRLFRLAEGDLRATAQKVSCHQDIAADGAFSLGMMANFENTIRATGAWWYRRLFWEAGVLGQVLYLEAEAAGIRGTGIGCYFDDAMHQLLGLTGAEFQSLYHFTIGGPVEDRRLTTMAPYFHLTGRERVEKAD